MWIICASALAMAGGCRSASSQEARPNGADDCTLVESGFGPEGSVSIRVETAASGLEVPWGLAFLPDGSMLVTERPGRIRRVVDGDLIEQPVARVDAVSRAEGGLLGLALHPDFRRQRTFYIYVTVEGSSGPENRIERWKLSENYRTAERQRVIFDGIPAARFHDGGRIAFGTDGMLYVGTGDATEPDLAQKLPSPAGKILRLTPEGTVPADNPFTGSPVFALGVRNLEAFDWRDDGALVVADHGPSGELGRSGHDEVSVVQRGANLGWPTIYGCQSRGKMVVPSLTWRKAVPPGGGAIYTGDAIEEWTGDFIVGTLGSRHLHRVVFDREDRDRVARHEVYLQGEHGRLRTVVMGPDKELYVTTSNCDGRGQCPADKDKILRITGAQANAAGTGRARRSTVLEQSYIEVRR